MKKCTKCGEIKSLAEYNKRSSAKDGLQHICKPCNIKACSRYAKSSQGKSAHYKRTYNLDEEEYKLFVLKQKNSCAICGTSAKKTAKGLLVIDHCHTSGVVRGLLCDPCNRGLGAFRDKIDSLKNAITYLEANQWAAVEK